MKNIIERIKEMVMLAGLLLLLATPFVAVKGLISYISGPRSEITAEYEADCKRLGELRKELSRLKEIGAGPDSIERVVKEMGAIERKHATPRRI